MYKVTIKNDGVETVIHHHALNDSKLPSGQIKQGINVADSFSFTILPNNPGYSLIRPLNTLVTVFNTRTGKTEFDGRILMPTESMVEDGSFTKSFICESELGYLNDSCQRYGEYHNITVRQFLEIIIANHNNDVDGDEIDKKFAVGNVTVTDSNDSLYRYLGYEQTFDTLGDKLLNRLGGELVVRKENGVRYLDYLTVAGEVKSTQIRLAKNLKSIQKEIDPNEIITKLIPLGKTIESSEAVTGASQDRLTIASVNNGKDFIIDEAAKAEFGIQTKSIIWDDITDPAILLSKGQSYLQENNRVKTKYSITALDLWLIGLDTNAFEKGNSYPVINPIMGINETLRVTEKVTDIINPNKNSLAVGDVFKTMSQYQYESNKAAQQVTQLQSTVSKQGSEIQAASNELSAARNEPDGTEHDSLEEHLVSIHEKIETKTVWVDISAAPFNVKGYPYSLDDTTAFKLAIALAETLKKPLYVPAGIYILTESLIPSSSNFRMYGDGVDEYVPAANDISKKWDVGTHLVFKGTGAKVHELYGVSDMEVSGGVVTNPDNPSENYALSSFMNKDAAATAPATSKKFSAGIVLRNVHNCELKGFRIIPYYDSPQSGDASHPMSGYNNTSITSTSALSDAWDVGILLHNASRNRVENVQSVGHWRMFGVLDASIRETNAPYIPTAESNRFVFCMFQGFKGFGVRSGDVFKVTAVTSDTIQIPFSASSPFSSSGKARISTTYYDYTSITQTGDKLTFNGVTPDPVEVGVSVGSTLRYENPNYGFAGTIIEDCYISGFDHQSDTIAQAYDFSNPSSCIEISGDPIRGIEFNNCTIQTREDVIAHLHDCQDVHFNQCYFESKAARTLPTDASNSRITGARFIASPFYGNNNRFTYAIGDTSYLQFNNCTDNGGIDFMPRLSRERTLRFTGAGLFEPKQFKHTEKIMNNLALYPITAAEAVNNSIFLDSADNVLKFKDSLGTVKTVNLT